MNWKIEFSLEADKYLAKLDFESKKMIQNYINNKLLKSNHPKHLGKALIGNFKGLWRYRIDKFRMICKIKEDRFIILLLKIGSRDKVYD